ncbi:toxin secretion ABC transporter ATP-binding protein [Legionella geestiana]|uniref:Toxin secretion ABC transporter ATP-binding protein n=1 Tax=Legionella geestiana TaxID=45065 RepID=A0A0W0TWJ5_9GAMM|nr:ABC transporter ATP-binding protein [Legionella geestiana]KTD00152.1 toxin secretion ABC transporter ATP-binding protein [Legionella geestiana]QBS11804.1 ABC transporter ATP-binding protein [Legionella geestiana]QDQ40582.1 ABC transporter ATP-binding protein [Legionella geestiana]STX53503.1 toxin secretion ABC transporter ATP-binding protein [Legionella geestiana]
MNAIRDVLDRATIASIVMISVLASLLTLGVPIAAQTLINLIAFGGLLQPVITLSIMMLVLMLALGALNIWQIFIVEVIQQKLMVNISLNLTRQFTHISLDTFSTHHGPELVNRYFEVVTIKKSLASLLLYGISLSLQIFFGLLLLVIYHPLFLLFDALILAGIGFIVWLPYKKAMESAKMECSEKHHVGAWLEEILINRFLFRFSHFSRFALKKTDRHLVAFLKARNLHFRQLVKHQVGFYLLSALISSILLGLGGYLVIENQLSLGQLVAAEIVLGTFIYAFKRFGVLLENYYDLRASLQKIEAVTEMPAQEVRTDFSNLFLPVKQLTIRAQTGNEGIARVQKPLFLVCDKPDIARSFSDFISGFNDTPVADVLINGNRCDFLHLSSLRHHALLLRRPEWFAGNLHDNLLLNTTNISKEFLTELLEYFGLFPRILALPEGMHTLIYDWQTVFTEEECIQLMMIRARLLEPQILIIDSMFDGFPASFIAHCLKPFETSEKTIVLALIQSQYGEHFPNRLALS